MPLERPHLLVRHDVRSAALQAVPVTRLRQARGERGSAVHLVFRRELTAVKFAQELLRLKVRER